MILLYVDQLLLLFLMHWPLGMKLCSPNENIIFIHLWFYFIHIFFFRSFGNTAINCCCFHILNDNFYEIKKTKIREDKFRNIEKSTNTVRYTYTQKSAHSRKQHNCKDETLHGSTLQEIENIKYEFKVSRKTYSNMIL